MQFLRELLERMEKTEVDDTLFHEFEVGSDDRVVGELPVELRRFYTLVDGLRKELAELQKQLQAELDKSPRKARRMEIHQEYDVAVSRYKMTRELFWSEVRCAFPEIVADKEVGIRKRWKVVTKTPKKCAACEIRQVCPLLMIGETIAICGVS